ncbi:MAG TPA: hypothetical protein VJB99_00610 [Patescibacteria group bacterium]|nr:hypothetical protein [Patescibacteria group bacterium]
MSKIAVCGLLLGTLLFIGAGCTNSSSSSTAPSSQKQSENQNTVPTPSPTKNEQSTEKTQTVSCTKQGTVTVQSSEDLLTHDLFLNGEKIATGKTEGPMDAEASQSFLGITLVPFQYNGIGGYIPYKSYPFFYVVNPCTKEALKIAPPQGTNASMHAASPDGSMVVYADNAGHVGILATGLKTIAYESPSQWSTSNVSEGLLGDFVFSPDMTKLAFAASDGPATGSETEHGSAYILDLETGAIQKVASHPSTPMHVNGWKNDGTVDSK